MAKRLVFTISNSINYDQRMSRICTSLSNAGYQVTLVGSRTAKSAPLSAKSFTQKRLFCLFSKGFLFFAEYNIRLFFFLLFKKTDLICSIDLDTVLPGLLVSHLRSKKRVYDAHELFCEMKEIVERPKIYRVWKKIEQFALPKYPLGYTVNQALAQEYYSMYKHRYEVLLNVPNYYPLQLTEKKERYFIYSGALNKGNSFETLIPAMQYVNARLYVTGEGSFYTEARKLVKQYELTDKIIFVGFQPPENLIPLTTQGYIGLTLIENKGKSFYLSLANRFFDYVQAGIPQICVNFPAYAELNNDNPVALLIDDLSSKNIAQHLNLLLNNDVLYKTLQENCFKMREQWSWDNQEKTLLRFYKKIFSAE